MNETITNVASINAGAAVPTQEYADKNYYHIPMRYRKMENLHIVFWLLKDLSWCMFWRPLGIAMILPTLVIAIIICWRTRHLVSELCHNLAIVLWITANCYWMLSEFFHFDTLIVFGTLTYKYLAIIPFVLGIAALAWYYLWYVVKEKKVEESN